MKVKVYVLGDAVQILRNCLVLCQKAASWMHPIHQNFRPAVITAIGFPTDTQNDLPISNPNCPGNSFAILLRDLGNVQSVMSIMYTK